MNGSQAENHLRTVLQHIIIDWLFFKFNCYHWATKFLVLSTLISFISIFCCRQLKLFFILFHFYEWIKERKKKELVSLLVAIMIMFSVSYSIVKSSIYRLGPSCITCYFLLQTPNPQMKGKICQTIWFWKKFCRIACVQSLLVSWTVFWKSSIAKSTSSQNRQNRVYYTRLPNKLWTHAIRLKFSQYYTIWQILPKWRESDDVIFNVTKILVSYATRIWHALTINPAVWW